MTAAKTPSSSTRPKRKGVRFAEASSDQPRPDLSLLLVQFILANPINRPMLLKKNKTQLQELLTVLDSYFPVLSGKLTTRQVQDRNEIKKLSLAWDSLIRLSILLQPGILA